MAKDNFKIFFCLFVHNFFFVLTHDVIEAEELSRSFTFAAVVNTSSGLDSEDQIVARHQARSAVYCAHKCLTNKQCQVIGFNAKSGVCWLMKSAGKNGLLESQDNLILIKVRFDHEEAPEPGTVEEFSSCKEVLEKGRSKGNGFYNIKTRRASSTKTYCHMDPLPDCGGGGWTLTMKIDGSKDTLDYNSSYWTNRQEFETENGLGLEEQETKLPTYWSTPLTKICLGMKMRLGRTAHTKWLKLELKQRAASLYVVMSSGYPAQPYTLLGANKWKDTFMPIARYTINSLQEGVNVTFGDSTARVRVRLGVIYRIQNSLRLTYIGFGIWASWHERYGINVSCGYGRETSSWPYFVKKPAFCHILVQ